MFTLLLLFPILSRLPPNEEMARVSRRFVCWLLLYIADDEYTATASIICPPTEKKEESQEAGRGSASFNRLCGKSYL
jgi:hypothetical protein